MAAEKEENAEEINAWINWGRIATDALRAAIRTSMDERLDGWVWRACTGGKPGLERVSIIDTMRFSSLKHELLTYNQINALIVIKANTTIQYSSYQDGLGPVTWAAEFGELCYIGDCGCHFWVAGARDRDSAGSVKVLRFVTCVCLFCFVCSFLRFEDSSKRRG